MGRMQYAPTHSAERSGPSTAFPSSKRMGFKNVPPNPQPTRIGKSGPWAFLSSAGRIRRRMQYAPTHSTGRKIDPWAFSPLAGRIRGRMQYAPTHSTGRKSVSLAFSPLAGRARGRMQYAPTHSTGRKRAPWAFSSLAGRAGGGCFCAPTHSAGRKSDPLAFPSSKRMGFKNVPPNPQPTRIGKITSWAFSSLAGRARGGYFYAPTHSAGRKSAPLAFSFLVGRAGGGYFCDLSLLVFSDHYPQTYFSFLVFRIP